MARQRCHRVGRVGDDQHVVVKLKATLNRTSLACGGEVSQVRRSPGGQQTGHGPDLGRGLRCARHPLDRRQRTPVRGRVAEELHKRHGKALCGRAQERR